MSKYSVTQLSINTLLAWASNGEIAIPEIQRPFVWEAIKVRNLIDSLYQGYPVGYLIAWRNPTVRLKDGTTSIGKRVLIDGQQRITALMAGMLGREVLTRDYDTVRIRIAFNPQTEKFEVANPAISKDPAWLYDVADVFSGGGLFKLRDEYTARNPGVEKSQVESVLEKLYLTVQNQVGLIELAEDLDIETVTEIFIRVNSAGAELSQADFAMSKIAANTNYGGNLLRKAIDYFCHLTVAPEFFSRIEKGDHAFVESDFFQPMKWLKGTNDDIYVPTYTDMLRVAFTSKFGRGKLADLVALLSGRNFETRQFEAEIAEQSFGRLKEGILAFINQTHFERITMILRSAGFVSSDLIGGQNAVNFAYILYLRGRAEKVPATDLEHIVRRWYVMSILRGRYVGSPETTFDADIRQVEAHGLVSYSKTVFDTELSDSFWSGMLPQLMETSSTKSPYFLSFKAAQAKLGDRGFLSRDITVRDLLLNRSDVHHVFPRNHLRKRGLAPAQYNQIANFVIAQSEINIVIGDTAPETYFAELKAQCGGGPRKYGGITSLADLKENLHMNCLPETLLSDEVPNYAVFLEQRRKLMALKIQQWFEAL